MDSREYAVRVTRKRKELDPEDSKRRSSILKVPMKNALSEMDLNAHDQQEFEKPAKPKDKGKPISRRVSFADVNQIKEFSVGSTSDDSSRFDKTKFGAVSMIVDPNESTLNTLVSGKISNSNEAEGLIINDKTIMFKNLDDENDMSMTKLALEHSCYINDENPEGTSKQLPSNKTQFFNSGVNDMEMTQVAEMSKHFEATNKTMYLSETIQTTSAYVDCEDDDSERATESELTQNKNNGNTQGINKLANLLKLLEGKKTQTKTVDTFCNEEIINQDRYEETESFADYLAILDESECDREESALIFNEEIKGEKDKCNIIVKQVIVKEDDKENVNISEAFGNASEVIVSLCAVTPDNQNLVREDARSNVSHLKAAKENKTYEKEREIENIASKASLDHTHNFEFPSNKSLNKVPDRDETLLEQSNSVLIDDDDDDESFGHKNTVPEITPSVAENQEIACKETKGRKDERMEVSAANNNNNKDLEENNQKLKVDAVESILLKALESATINKNTDQTYTITNMANDFANIQKVEKSNFVSPKHPDIKDSAAANVAKSALDHEDKELVFSPQYSSTQFLDNIEMPIEMTSITEYDNHITLQASPSVSNYNNVIQEAVPECSMQLIKTLEKDSLLAEEPMIEAESFSLKMVSEITMKNENEEKMITEDAENVLSKEIMLVGTEASAKQQDVEDNEELDAFYKELISFQEKMMECLDKVDDCVDKMKHKITHIAKENEKFMNEEEALEKEIECKEKELKIKENKLAEIIRLREQARANKRKFTEDLEDAENQIRLAKVEHDKSNDIEEVKVAIKRMLKYVPWNLKLMSASEIKVTFLWDTIELKASLGDLLPGHNSEDLAYPPRNVVNVAIQSKLSEMVDISPIKILSSSAAWHSIHQTEALNNVNTTFDFAKCLNRVSVIAEDAKILAQDLHAISIRHKVNISDFVISIEFLTITKYWNFILRFTLEPNTMMCFIPATFQHLLGKVQEMDIINLVNQVKHGPMYLKRVVDEIDKFID